MNGKSEITTYINNFITDIKQADKLDTAKILKQNIRENLLLGIIIWIIGSTVIGMPFVYGIIGYRGFCLGYTIASIIAVLGYKNRNNDFPNWCISSEYNIYSKYNINCNKWNKIV